MHKDRHYITACQYHNLVYVGTLKCASTFFYFNFIQELKWAEINWQDINWEKYHVFGHIQDPVVRRHKAIAERLSMFNLEKFYFDNRSLQKFLQDSIILDQHGETYCNRYGSAVNKIDWIPLIGESKEIIRLTEMCMRHYMPQLPKIEWNFNYANASTDIQKKLQLHLENMWNVSLYCKELTGWKKHQLADDIELYGHVVEKFNPSASDWKLISWLQ